MKPNYYVMLFLLCSVFGFSQNVEISGTVKEAGTGATVPGANYQVKGSSIAGATDLDGNFSIADVPRGAVIVFSYIGYKDLEYVANASASGVVISMESSTNKLEEIVMIGYGGQKKKEVTGAVGTLSAKTLETLKPINAVQALQGTVSGVIINSNGGSPGAGLSINIRGVASNGTNTPLYLIDGYQGDPGLLNPQDIENISILKDAQAAIYGTIGANGVVIITTKKGRRNTPTKYSYNGYTGFQQTDRKLPMLNATEYALLLNEAYANGGQALPYPNASGLGIGTNWQDEVFNDAPITNHEFSISGGGEKMSYMISGADLTQEGIIGERKSHFKRNTARIALDADLSDKLKLSTNFNYAYMDRDTFNDFALGSVLFNAVNAPPTLAPRDANGNFTLVPSTPGLGIEIINPLAQLHNTYNDYDLNRINGTMQLEYKLLKGLTVTGRIGVFNQTSKSKTFSPIVEYGGKVFDVQRSSVTQGAVRDNNYTMDLFATYTNTFFNDHNVTFTVGTTAFKEWGNGLYATGYDVPNNSWDYADISLSTGLPTATPVSSYNYDNRRNSQFFRLQYAYKEKYLASIMQRRDASTYFGPNNRVAYFPSATLGWVVSKESFFGENGFVNFLKLRGSYGFLGNDQIGANRYLGSLSGEATYVLNGQLVNGTALGVLANPDVKWERAKKVDIGLDMNFWKSRFEFVADYYINTRDGLLISGLPVSGTTGIGAPGSGAPTYNAGSTRNSGFEFALGYNDKINDNFSFGINYNLTTLKNEVTAVRNNTFIEGGAFGVGQPAPARMTIGQPIGVYYGYQTDGIYQNQAEVDAGPDQIALGAAAQPGDIRYVDRNGDGAITTADRTYIGKPTPDLIMGFNFNVAYKGFDLSGYAYASLGNDLVRNYERALSDVNRLDYVLDRWTGEGTSNTVPRVTTGATGNNVFSDYYVEDASFARIQNVQFGYSIPKTFLEKAKIERLRLYVMVNNAYTFTKYRGYDPGFTGGDPISSGLDNGVYPVSRNYLFGVNLTF